MLINQKVVIIIPTYNEASVIQETLEAVFHETASITFMDIHVLVFDSASTDKTQQIVQALQGVHPRLHLKTETKKSGLGSAYLQAMRFALDALSADIVMEFDADLSHQPSYIAPMLEKMKMNDVVIGSRYIEGGQIPEDWGWKRKMLSALGNWIARLILTPRYKDFTSGFRATHKNVLASILPELFLSSQYAYKLHLLWLLHKNKAKILEYPISFMNRQKGESKLPAYAIFDSLKVLLVLRFFGMFSDAKLIVKGK